MSEHLAKQGKKEVQWSKETHKVWERDRGKERGRETGGRLDRGGGGGPRSSGMQGAHRQWGNNDMKELNWRSHTALAHLRRHKISWPLHVHTYRHTQTYMNDSKATYTCRCTFAHWHKESLSHTHTHTQPEALKQREVSSEQNIQTQLSSQPCLRWLTFKASVDAKTQHTTNNSWKHAGFNLSFATSTGCSYTFDI